jgi:hypothetical protein
MRLAPRGRHRPRVRTVLYAVLAGTLALAGCSDILGGGESVPVEEVHLVDDDGSSFILAGSGGTAHFHVAIAQGYTQHVRFRFANRNGVPATDPEAYSVNIVSIANPAVFAWQPESDVLRGDSVVYHSPRIGVDVYPGE